MTARTRLPNRRRGESREFVHAGHAFTICAGFYPDGRLGEIFISAHKSGAQIEAIARDAAILLSLCLATLIGAALDALMESEP